MYKTIITLSCIFISFIALAENKVSQVLKPDVIFTENKGQVSDQYYNPRPDVLYSGTDGMMNYYIRNNGISYQLSRVDSWIEKEKIRGFGEKINYPNQITNYRVDVNWKNTNKNCKSVTDESIPGYNNYYLAVCPQGVTNVRSYKGVTLKNIYLNIDIHYYENEGNLEYDFIVAPNSDYKQISLEVEGAELEFAEDGGVIFKTPLGDIKEESPVVYQNGKQLKAKWIIKGNSLSFDISDYNKNYELIIDPVTRVWGTYCGGSGNDQAQSCLADASGNSYLYGHTESSNLIATTGSHQNTFGGGGFDVFLVKFDSNAIRLWGTYMGGSGGEVGSAAVIDASGNVYISGETSSSTAIATSGTQQPASGGQMDAFLVKFDSDGVRQWGTYYGGSGADSGKNLAIDPFGNYIVIAGETSSQTGMVGGGVGGQSYGGGNWDAFVAKFNTSGIRQWGTYYGGSVLDDGYACTTDISGNVYLLGLTESANNIASSNAYQATMNGPRDAFFVKFNSSGTRQWGTYFGGTGIDVGTAATSDATGNLYFCGWTTSGNNISTAGTQQTAYAGGSDDSYIVKFRTNGTRVWGTYIGGSGYDHINGCFSDSGYVYIAGASTSSNAGVIASTDGYQTTLASTSADAILVKYDTTGVRKWGTLYGGSGTDVALSCTVDNQGNAYLGGISYSASGIVTSGTHQTTMSGPTDAFLVKFKYSTSVGIIQDESNLLLNVFPNPTSGEIRIDMGKSYANVLVKVRNITGQIISNVNFESTNSILLNIEGAPGLYLVEVKTEDAESAIIKVLKK